MDWTNLAQVETRGGLFECRNETSGSIKYWAIIKQLGD